MYNFFLKNNMTKHIHFIGICGVAMGGLAMAMKRAGFKVSGSDVGIYPPISTYLKERGGTLNILK